MEDSEGKVFWPEGTAKVKATGENQHGVWSVEEWIMTIGEMKTRCLRKAKTTS